MGTPLVEVQDVVVRYRTATVLDRVFVRVAHGESVALVGPSGAGKTTLLLAMAGLVAPASGAVLFDGRDLGRMSPDERAAIRLVDVGFVMQGGELMPELTLVENVELPLRMAGTARDESRERALRLLAGLGVDRDTARRAPDEVSGGQAQRAAVARAVIHGPRVVFADEPTGALDSASGRDVMRALLGAVTGVGAALVMVTHDRDLASQLGRVVEVRDGRVSDLVSASVEPGP